MAPDDDCIPAAAATAAVDGDVNANANANAAGAGWSRAVRHALCVGFAVLMGGWVHRLTLLKMVERELARGESLVGRAWGAAWHHAELDVIVACALAAAAYAIVRLIDGGFGRFGWPLLHPLWLILSTLPALLALGALRRGHLEMVAALHVGLGADELLDVLRSGEAATASFSASAAQWMLAGAPALALIVAAFLAWRARGVQLVVIALLGVGALGSSLVAGQVSGMPEEAHLPPELWTTAQVATAAWQSLGAAFGDVDDDLLVAPSAAASATDVAVASAAAVSVTDHAGSAAQSPTRGVAAPGQRRVCDDTGIVPSQPELVGAQPGLALARIGARFVDPRLVAPETSPTTRPGPSAQRYNVLWVVMESTGSRYVDGVTYPFKRPMPFFDQLAAEGWHLSAHRSPSNSSATSIAAQMTGLYPMPSLKMMAVDKDNRLTALPAFLRGYDRFLVTPGKLDYFFPRALLNASGLNELTGFHELAQLPIRAEDKLARDEIATVDHFIARLQRAKPPFFGVYYSFVPHWEYTDYGPSWRRYRGVRLIDHYHNSLSLLDAQIRRIVDALKASGRLDDTVIVLVGDHGEAFGQHERNWAHSRGSFEENLQTPAVLWQPRLFAPRRVAHSTSHIDLLPTVLDALGVRYEARLLQGESLFQAKPRRRVTFHWGNEGTVTALRHVDGIKLQISIKGKQCHVYDLQRDANERRPKSCKGYQPLLDATRAFVRTQRALLPALSEAAGKGLAFEGFAHPSLAPSSLAPSSLAPSSLAQPSLGPAGAIAAPAPHAAAPDAP